VTKLSLFVLIRKNLSLVLVLALFTTFAAAQETVHVQVDAGNTQGPFQPVWAYFGADEPNYSYAPQGKELVGELSALSPVPVQIRVHNLLTTGDGTGSLKWGSTNAYTEDASGKPIYDWKIVDRIFDTYLETGAKPFVEIGFMPQALSVHPEPYRHDFPQGEIFTGWAYPPNDYKKWAELVHQLVLHCAEKYGKAQVETWNWELWNEPDIPYWKGTPEEYNKLYDYTVDAVRRALPNAKVGGPATTGPARKAAGEYLRQFLEHCANGKNFVTGKTGTPLDFITFHAKGQPKVVDGHVQMGLLNNLRDVDEGLAIVASFPKFASLPIVLSESDPEGCAACSVTTHPQNAYRNGTMYPSYTAAAVRNILDLNQKHKTNLQGILTWAFEFEDQPYFAGFRDLATNGVDKPVLNLFRVLGMMANQRVAAVSSGALDVAKILDNGVRDKADVDAIATRTPHRVTVLLWNYHDDDVSAPDAPIKLDISGLPEESQKIMMRHYRIDHDHSNAYTVWKELGSPQNPTLEQYAKLKAAGQLQLLGSPQWAENKLGTVTLEFALPRQAVSLVELAW
jgi:xylan 1,4-beta-xylosidase